MGGAVLKTAADAVKMTGQAQAASKQQAAPMIPRRKWDVCRANWAGARPTNSPGVTSNRAEPSGEAIRPEQGYAARLLLPSWEGSTNIK
jgi:DMSO/TMAO reductase YedYZ molybdopterin-dependent catalytic subunit